MKLYIYPKCSTCQKALRFLEKKNLRVEIVEIQKQPPSVEELTLMLTYQKGSLKKLFNTSGIQYREKNLSQKLPQMSVPDALELLSQNGMLVKRPFLLGENFGLLGFNESEWSQKWQ